MFVPYLHMVSPLVSLHRFFDCFVLLLTLHCFPRIIFTLIYRVIEQSCSPTRYLNMCWGNILHSKSS